MNAEASLRAYASDWRIFRTWCELHEVACLPASPETVAAFFADQVKGARLPGGKTDRPKEQATILRYRASISKGHSMNGHPSPCADARVKIVLKGLKRRKGAGSPHAKLAFTAAIANASLDRLTLRDRAILLLGFATATRRNELCSLNLSDLTWRSEGLVVHLRKSKTDQLGVGRDIAVPRLENDPTRCPVETTRQWVAFLASRGVTSGPLFRAIYRGGNPRPGRLSSAQVANIVQRAAAMAGLNPEAFGGHSLRARYVTQARKAGQPWATIMEQTGHKRIETVQRYARETADPFKTSKGASEVVASLSSKTDKEKKP